MGGLVFGRCSEDFLKGTTCEQPGSLSTVASLCKVQPEVETCSTLELGAVIHSLGEGICFTEVIWPTYKVTEVFIWRWELLVFLTTPPEHSLEGYGQISEH